MARPADKEVPMSYYDFMTKDSVSTFITTLLVSFDCFFRFLLSFWIYFWGIFSLCLVFVSFGTMPHFLFVFVALRYLVQYSLKCYTLSE